MATPEVKRMAERVAITDLVPIDSRPIQKNEWVMFMGRRLGILDRERLAKGSEQTKLDVVSKAMVQFIKSDAFLKLTAAQRFQVFENVEFLNKKIEKYNNKLSAKPWLYLLDLILYVVTLSFYRLKHRVIDLSKLSDRMIEHERKDKVVLASFQKWHKELVDLHRTRFTVLMQSERLASLAKANLEQLRSISPFRKLTPPGVPVFGHPGDGFATTRLLMEAQGLSYVYQIASHMKFSREADFGSAQDKIFRVARHVFKNFDWNWFDSLPTTKEGLEILLQPIPVYGNRWISQPIDSLSDFFPTELQSKVKEYANPTTNLLEICSAAALRSLQLHDPTTFIYELLPKHLIDESEKIDRSAKNKVLESLFVPYQQGSEYRTDLITRIIPNYFPYVGDGLNAFITELRSRIDRASLSSKEQKVLEVLGKREHEAAGL